MPEGPIQPAPSAAQPAPAATPPAQAHPHKTSETPKETVISIVIAFAMAFVFRGFVVEAFVIPTGSMAPTLLGQHMRFYEPSSGNDWEVGPWQANRGLSGDYPTVQKNIRVHDPLSGAEQTAREVPLRSGDRILVLKYLYAVFSPKRFDVVVFKDPHNTLPEFPTRPPDNYIKRLIGLPGEQIALVNGDVFVRTPRADDPPHDPLKLWSLPGWSIARKPTLVQEAVWQPVFDSALAPIPEPIGFQRPWRADESGWSFDAGRFYEWKPTPASATTSLKFDQTRVRYSDRTSRENGIAYWSINDSYPYNETPIDDFKSLRGAFAVPDTRLRAGIEPLASPADGLSVSAVIVVNSHEFRAQIEGDTARIRVRKPSGEAGVMVWQDVASAKVRPFEADRVTNVEFSHADQALRLYVDDQLVIGPVTLDWTIAERFRFATGKPLEGELARQRTGFDSNVLNNPALYARSAPEVRWDFEWKPTSTATTASSEPRVRLHRVGVDRDLYYRPDSHSRYIAELPAGLATSPFAPVALKPDQFFCCGDNSPQSLDGRLWGAPNPWVARDFGSDYGVVPRELMLGKAFFVYWPSLLKGQGPIPVPDFGRMRFIW